MFFTSLRRSLSGVHMATVRASARTAKTIRGLTGTLGVPWAGRATRVSSALAVMGSEEFM